jgi:hypothetical protein
MGRAMQPGGEVINFREVRLPGSALAKEST